MNYQNTALAIVFTVTCTATTNPPCTCNTFDGSDRKKAKLSIPVAAEETFDNLDDLFATLLHFPPILTHYLHLMRIAQLVA